MVRKLPKVNGEALSDDIQFTFGGINQTKGARDGDIYSCVNMTSDHYPVLSPRKKRGLLKSFGQRTIYGFGFSKKLYYCADDENNEPYFYYDDEKIFPVSADKKTFTVINGFICIFPDKKYFFEKACDAKNYKSDNDNNVYQDIEELHEAFLGNGAVKDGDIYVAGNSVFFYNSSGFWDEDHPTPYVYDAQSEWIYLAEIYGSLERSLTIGETEDEGNHIWMKESLEGAGEDTLRDLGSHFCTIRKGDTLRLKVTYRKVDSDGDVKKRYKSYIATVSDIYNDRKYYYFEFAGIKVPEYVDSDGEATTSSSNSFYRYAVRAENVLPDFSTIFCHNNRLWGTEKNIIYASALGDPFNFKTYSDSASASFSVTSESAGDFTAGCSFDGYPTFFKEDSLIKIAGDYPSEYTIYETNDIQGVKEGEGKSLTSCKGYLFYVSNEGICSYSGAFPTVISDNIGKYAFKNAISGSSGRKVYISTDDRIYVYDIKRRLWMAEDYGKVLYFSSDAGILYGLNEKDNTIYAYSESELAEKEKSDVESEVIFAPIYRGSVYKKSLGRICLEANKDPETEIEVYISYDGGEFEKICDIKKVDCLIPLIIRRCRYYQLKIKGKGDYKINALMTSSYEGSMY